MEKKQGGRFVIDEAKANPPQAGNAVGRTILDGSVEWRGPTRAVRDYLDSVGISEPGLVARALLNEFGSLSNLLSASWWQLRRIVGIRVAETILASRDLMHAALAEPLEDGPVVPRSPALINFLQAQIGFLDHEVLIAIYVNSRLELMRLERISDGCLNRTHVNFRKIINCGLSIGASGFILVHNHPSGIPAPSQTDMTITAQLRMLAAELDLHLVDHIIVARGKFGTIEEHWREARWAGEQE